MTPAELQRPRLVPLEPRPVVLDDGSRAVALRDPLGILGEERVVTGPAWMVLAHCDGQRSLDDIQAALRRRGAAAGRGVLEGLVREAIDAGLLVGPAYAALRRQALHAWRSAPVRSTSCAGSAYPADPAALRRLLDGFLDRVERPTRRTGSRRRGPGPVRLLVSPHIDYARGGPTYAHAWSALAEGCDADLFVVFGTAHATPDRPFTLTRQGFATPLGTVSTDARLVDRLVEALGEDTLLGDELCHKQEHSLELQLVWLRHVLGGRDVPVVPVLCSSLSHLHDPAAAAAPFLDALARAVAGRKVCWVAGADLAHVGPGFGDERPPSPAGLAALAREDVRTMGFVARGDALGFHRDAVRDGARRRLCGAAPIYAALRMAGRGARLLHHAQWSDGTDAVSFAAAAG